MMESSYVNPFRDGLELLRLLARGEKEIEAGKGYDLETVFEEADALFRELSSRKHPRAT